MDKGTVVNDSKLTADPVPEAGALKSEALNSGPLSAEQLFEVRIQEVRAEAESSECRRLADTDTRQANSEIAKLKTLGIEGVARDLEQVVQELRQGGIYFAVMCRSGFPAHYFSLDRVEHEDKHLAVLIQAVISKKFITPTQALKQRVDELSTIIENVGQEEQLPAVPFVAFGLAYVSHYADLISRLSQKSRLILAAVKSASERLDLPSCVALEPELEVEDTGRFFDHIQLTNCGFTTANIEGQLSKLEGLSRLFLKYGSLISENSEDLLRHTSSSGRDAKLKSAADEAERQYRTTDEARVLRLCRELAESQDISSAARKTARQLDKKGLHAVLNILGRFKQRLENYEDTKTQIKSVLSRPEIAQEANTESQDRDQPRVIPATKVEPPALSKEELEALRRHVVDQLTDSLLECGVEDEDTIYQLVSHEPIDIVVENVAILKAYTEIDPRYRGLLVQTNPTILMGTLDVALTSFLKQVQRTLEVAATLPGYEDAFSLELHPEHYAFPDLLARTYEVARRLSDIVGQVREEFRRKQQDAQQTQENKSMPESELVLVEQLRRFVEKPFVAYAIMRLAFRQSGGYTTRGVSRPLRDRRVQSAFSTPPVAQDVRQCERQLVSAGLLQKDYRSTQPLDNLMLCAPKDMTDPSAKALLVALRDESTIEKAKIPKLPFE